MFKLRQNGLNYEIVLTYYANHLTPLMVTETVLLTTDVLEEATAVLTTLHAKGLDSLKKVATDAGKTFYRGNIPRRNEAIVRRHLVNGESIASLADRFRVHQSTIRTVLDSYRPPVYPVTRIPYGGSL